MEMITGPLTVIGLILMSWMIVKLLNGLLVVSDIYAKHNAGWISVKRRLPTAGELVLVWDGKERFTCYQEAGYWKSFRVNGRRISHWSYLKEPPVGRD